MNIWKVQVADEYAGWRLDAFWQAYLSDAEVPRARIQQWIRAGLAQIERAVCRKPATRLVPGQHLILQGEMPGSEVKPLAGPLEVLLHEGEVVVLNKPAGLTVHPAPSVHEPTLVEYAAWSFPVLLQQGGVRPGIVHRLDKDTSGALVLALSEATRVILSRDFAERGIFKEYLTLVAGVPPVTGRITHPVGRHKSIKTRMAVVPDGRVALTEYTRLWSARDGSASLLRVRLHTGRTHQIRVHMAAEGFPLLGDEVYAPREVADRAERQMLHAWRLAFTHPQNGHRIRVQARPPEDFLEQLKLLGRQRCAVALTGMPGSGKSAVRKVLESAGLPALCADTVVRQTCQPGGEGWSLLRQHFGRRFTPDDNSAVDKKVLTQALHDSALLRREVEGLLHPVVRRQIQHFFAQHPNALTVTEVPLLFEAGLEADFDVLVTVYCPDEIRHARLLERGWSAEHIALVDSWQWTQQAKVRAAHLLLENAETQQILTRRSHALARLLVDLHQRRERSCQQKIQNLCLAEPLSEDFLD